jgi:hypothetical protein
MVLLTTLKLTNGNQEAKQMSQSFALLECLLDPLQANQECNDDHYRPLPDVLK